MCPPPHLQKININFLIASQCEWLARLVAIAIATLGLAVLTGWIFDIAALKSVKPGLASMKANTAIGLLAGMALFFAGCRAWRAGGAPSASVSVAAVALLGLLTFGEYVSGADFGIDQLFFRTDTEPVSQAPPGRMALATAAGFALTGLALATLDSIRWRKVAVAAALAGCLIGIPAILGYAYDVAALYDVGVYSR